MIESCPHKIVENINVWVIVVVVVVVVVVVGFLL
jgi:hypothetical protein